MIEYERKAGNSSTWKGIIRSLNMTKGGFAWNIGTGEEVSIWFDIWVDNEPLCLLIEDIEPTETMWNVADIIIIKSNGSWDLGRLKTVIPNVIIRKIIAIHLNTSNNNGDKLVWKGSVNGTPTAKAFFKFITANEEDEPYTPWNWIWKLNCPQKMRFFIWLTNST